MGIGVGNYRRLLEDVEVNRWYQNLRRGSLITADNSLRQLGLLCKQWDTTPREIVVLHREGKLQGMLEDFVADLERKHYAGSYIHNILKAVKSWLEFNGLQLQRRIKVSHYNLNPRVADERVPTKEELAKIFRALGLKGRAAASLVAFAGLRLQTIGNYDGSDGLMISDLPELAIEGGSVTFKKIPTMIKVRPTLSKTHLPYFTFLPFEGCTYLKEYLEYRLKNEGLQPTSPIIKPEERGFEQPRPFMWTTKLSALLRRGIRKAGFNWRPYVLRAYADTAFDIAEAKGLISHPWRQFFMGHKGDIEARYSTNKGRLPPDMIEEMREAYRRCEPYLQTIQIGEAEDPQITTLRTMVESGVLDLSKPNVRQYLIQKLGIKDMEVRVAKMKESGLDEASAYNKIICEQLGIDPMKIEAFKPKENSDPKKIVSEDELDHYLAEGWDVQTVLPSGKILIRRAT
jgi:hypothetical protein